MKILITYSLVLCSLFSFAQNNLTLSDAINNSLENNFSIKIAKKEISIAENDNSWGKAGMLPTVNIGAIAGGKLENSPLSQAPYNNVNKTGNSITAFASVDWTIFSGFAIKITKSNLALLEKASQGNSVIVVENAIQATMLAYYKVLLENERLSVLNKVVALSKDRYIYWQTKQEIGSSGSYEALQAKNDYLTDSTNVLMQQMVVNSSKHKLNNLMGVEVANEYILTDTFNSEVKNYELGNLLAQMTNNNKTLQNQYVNQNLLKNSINLSKSGYYPRLSMSTGYNNLTSSQTPEGYPKTNYDTYDFYANFTLSFNLYNGGNTKRAIQNARIQEEVGLVRIDEMKHNLSTLLFSQLDLYHAQKQIYMVSEENLKSADLNLTMSEEKYKFGALSSINYRDVQIRYLSIATNRLQAIYDLISTDTELLRLTGGIISE